MYSQSRRGASCRHTRSRVGWVSSRTRYPKIPICRPLVGILILFLILGVSIYLFTIMNAVHDTFDKEGRPGQQARPGSSPRGYGIPTTTPRLPNTHGPGKTKLHVQSNSSTKSNLRRAASSQRNSECEVIIEPDGSVVNSPGRLLALDESVSDSVSDRGYEYFVVCVSDHAHHHRIEIDLHVLEGEADLYVSASEAYPEVERGSTWISASNGDDRLNLPTYDTIFEDTKPRALFIGVHGRPTGTFSLTVKVTDVEDAEARAHGPLRSRPA